MKLSKVMVFTYVLLLVGSLAFSEDRTDRYSFVISTSGVVGQCSGFQIVNDAVALFTFLDLYDKFGQLTQTQLVLRVIGETVYYNSSDPEKAIAGGPAEVAHATYDPFTGVVHINGVPYKVRIPGYGIICRDGHTSLSM